jgi:NAD(P)-dependent dehydrogenase (short-subunit alcohol dehydrogenase family)
VAANGGADIIVHVAGGGASAPSGGSAALTQELWHHMLQLNLLGAVRPDRETRTRTGDTTIFSGAVLLLTPAGLQGFSAVSR